MSEADNLPEPTGQPDYLGLAPNTKGELKKLARETGQFIKAGDPVAVPSRTRPQIHDYDLLKIRLPSQEVDIHLCPDGTVDFTQRIDEPDRITTSIKFQQGAQNGRIAWEDTDLHFSSENTPDLAATLGNTITKFDGSLYLSRQEDQTTYVGSIILELTSGEKLKWDCEIKKNGQTGEQEVKNEYEYKSQKDDDPNLISEDELPPVFRKCIFSVDVEEKNGEDVPVMRLETDETMLEAFVGEVIPKVFDDLPLLDRTHSSPQPLCRFALSIKKKQK
jgi:hypothetical protein